jgi:hypothetical protein
LKYSKVPKSLDPNAGPNKRLLIALAKKRVINRSVLFEYQ